MSDESRKAFDKFRSITCETTVPDEYFERILLGVWQSAIEWDRKYLAGLANNNPRMVVNDMDRSLTADEILKGKIEE